MKIHLLLILYITNINRSYLIVTVLRPIVASQLVMTYISSLFIHNITSKALEIICILFEGFTSVTSLQHNATCLYNVPYGISMVERSTVVLDPCMKCLIALLQSVQQRSFSKCVPVLSPLTHGERLATMLKLDTLEV
jgi:hypothetical protein